MGVSRRAYAKSKGVSHRAINYACERGVIRPLPDGTIDPKQADASWGVAFLRRLEGPVRDPEWEARMDELIGQLKAEVGYDAALAQMRSRAR